MKKIAVISGNRAEYGLLAPVMRRIGDSPSLDLQLIVTASHLLPEFGLTVETIERDGFEIDRKIPQISSALDGFDVAHQVGEGTVAFAEVFSELEPDVVVILGDRYEMFAAASAAFFLGIPILHVHGGEVTSGAFDDAIRHVISQLSHVHAVAAPEYRERLIRAGANPETVHVVGGLGVDSVYSLRLSPREELERELNLQLSEPLFLVTYHPVTRGQHDTKQDVKALVSALDLYPDATVVFTMPNTDPEHQEIVEILELEVAKRNKWFLFASLGSTKYLSLMTHAAVVIGNSSSGLTEAPSVGTPTVNIGPRQGGRLAAKSVLSCGPHSSEIAETIKRALEYDFVQSIEGPASPYGLPGAAERIVRILESTPLASLGEKNYYDPPTEV